MPLTRDEVVRVAVRLLDEIGLEALTLRRLAAELGVSAPTLYWHVRDKRFLLDLVAEEILAATNPPPRPRPEQPWWEWLRESASAQYRALVGHRDAALVVAGNRPSEASLPILDVIVGSLVEVGFPPREALESILTVGHFVIGSAMEYQAEMARAASDASDQALARRIRGAQELGNLRAALASRPSSDPRATFDYGLDLLITGLRARHAELSAVPT